MLKIQKQRATFSDIEKNHFEEYPDNVKEPKYPQTVEVYLQQSDYWYLHIARKYRADKHNQTTDQLNDKVVVKITNKQAKELYEYGILVGERG